MYTISASNATKFLTTDFIPVATDSTVGAAATDGAEFFFQVTNLGAGCQMGLILLLFKVMVLTPEHPVVQSLEFNIRW